MQYKDAEAERRWEEIRTSNDCALNAVILADQWAEMMELAIEKSERTVEDVAGTILVGIKEQMSVTEEMRLSAISILCDVWKYGEELKELTQKTNPLTRPN